MIFDESQRGRGGGVAISPKKPTWKIVTGTVKAARWSGWLSEGAAASLVMARHVEMQQLLPADLSLSPEPEGGIWQGPVCSIMCA